MNTHPLAFATLGAAPAYRSLRCWQYPHLARLLPERASVIDSNSGLGLPLMHHLVQHGMLDLEPRVASDVTPADSDLQRTTRPNVHRHLAQAGAHTAGEPDGDLTQRTAEVLRIQVVMQARESVQEGQITGTSPLVRPWPWTRRRVRFHRKRQELAFG